MEQFNNSQLMTCPSCGQNTPAGGGFCANCGVNLMSGAPHPTSQVPAQMPDRPACVQHRNVPAIARCNSCGTWICSTCDFSVMQPASTNSGGRPVVVHQCPRCATAPGARAATNSQPLPRSVGPKTCPRCREVNLVGRGACARCGLTFNQSTGPLGRPNLANPGFAGGPAATASVQTLPPSNRPSAPMCGQHPTVAASWRCERCGAGICGTCAFAAPQQASSTPGHYNAGAKLCPRCVPQPAPSAGTGWPGPPQPAGTVWQGAAPSTGTVWSGPTAVCPRHPSTDARWTCFSCGSPICDTCNFVYPGNLHVCPECITRPLTGMTQKRKLMVGVSFALAVWCTLGMVLMMTWAASGVSEEQSESAGAVIFVLVFIPSLIGTALGFGAMDKRLGNPTSVWIAAIWNSLISAIFIGLAMIGAMVS